MAHDAKVVWAASRSMSNHAAHVICGTADPEYNGFKPNAELSKMAVAAVNAWIAAQNAAASKKDTGKPRIFKVKLEDYVKLTKTAKAKIDKEYDGIKFVN